VAITAVGLVTGAGDSLGALRATLSNGVANGPRPIDGFEPRRYVDRRGMKHMARGSQLACAAAAGVARTLDGVPGAAVGVVYGSAWGCLNTIVRFERAAHVDGARLVDPLLFTETVANVPAGQVSIVFGWSALNATVSAGTASGLEAIRLAIDLVGDGRASIAVAGGGDESAVHVTNGAARGAASEGACLLAIEDETHARERGAVPLARIVASAGCYAGNDRRETDARCRRALERLLASAGLDAVDVDLLVAPGGLDDPAIAAARAALPDAAPWSPLPALGECWAANGPVAVAATLDAMERGALPGRAPARLGRAIVVESSRTGHVSALALEGAS
jgi:3-oxoacyl-[acyl-carrier-protein] synthase II